MKWRRRLPNNRARCCFRSRESVGNPGIDEFAGQLANARTTKDTVIVVKDRYRVSIPEKKRLAWGATWSRNFYTTEKQGSSNPFGRRK
jgi:hypothetical protein